MTRIALFRPCADHQLAGVDGVAVRIVAARIDQDRRFGDAIGDGQSAHHLGVRVRAVPGRAREDQPRRPAGPIAGGCRRGGGRTLPGPSPRERAGRRRRAPPPGSSAAFAACSTARSGRPSRSNRRPEALVDARLLLDLARKSVVDVAGDPVEPVDHACVAAFGVGVDRVERVRGAGRASPRRSSADFAASRHATNDTIADAASATRSIDAAITDALPAPRRHADAGTTGCRAAPRSARARATRGGRPASSPADW